MLLLLYRAESLLAIQRLPWVNNVETVRPARRFTNGLYATLKKEPATAHIRDGPTHFLNLYTTLNHPKGHIQRISAEGGLHNDTECMSMYVHLLDFEGQKEQQCDASCGNHFE